MLFTIVSLLTSLFLVVALDAQSTAHPTFRQYTTDSGMASSEVYCIVQDLEGFIWVSSDNGVSRFDGYEFQNFGVKDGLKENVIFVLQLDQAGNVWMQAMSGNIYHSHGDSIVPYWNNHLLQNYKDRMDVGKGLIVEGTGEVIHLATVKYGIISIEQDGTTITYEKDSPIYRQVFEKNGIAINGYYEKGHLQSLRSFTQRLNKSSRTPPIYFQTSEGDWSFDGLQYSNVDGTQRGEAFYLGDGKYLFQMFNDVWYIEKNKIIWKHHYPYHILHASIMDDGKLMIGLHFQEGLKVYRSLEEFRNNKGVTWLKGHSVSFFMKDAKSGLWIATNASGIFYAPAESIMIYDTDAGLSEMKVTSVTIKDSQNLFAGLENGEVWHLDRNSDKWRNLPPIPAMGYIRDLYYDQYSEKLWVGKEKLFYLNEDNWHLHNMPFEGSVISMGNRITGSLDRRRLWVSNHHGFMSIDLPQMDAGNLKMGRDQRTYVVVEDFIGRIWVGQSDGLYEWKDHTLIERQFYHPSLGLRIEDMCLMDDGTLVIATKGGGIVMLKDDEIQQLTTTEGLTADMMECVYADDQGNIWAGTLNGLNKISGSWGDFRIEQITMFNGLPSNEINQITSSEEFIWVATNKGLARFSSERNLIDSPQPIITHLLVNNEMVINRGDLIFGSSQNNIGVNFFAINFNMNGRIPYRFRMNRGEWTITLNRAIYFPSLSPGPRSFEVQAQNENGIWSESTFLTFTIIPPWWNSWWFKVIFGSLILLSGLGFLIWRTNKLNYEHGIQLQIKDLELSALQAQMNPHFIFNCLNSIQNFILQEDKEGAIKYLGNFASLTRSLLNASVAGKIPLAEEIKLLSNYLELENLRFSNRFSYTLKASDDIEIYDIEIPPLLIQPYVENAIKHGIAGKQKGGVVDIYFDKKDDYLMVSIKDNGLGMKEPLASESEQRHKPFGMSITKHRLDLLENQQKEEMVRILTLKDNKGEVAGTEVIIKIKLQEFTHNKPLK
jgi:ligand-binding sensor domain-containing protein